tara:strand:- start:5483 stop:6040 length:558 start_codon:yes stop_codon:yes gene_type:complete
MSIKKINIKFPNKNDELENPCENKLIAMKKTPKKRAITQTDMWKITKEDMEPDAQLTYIRQLVDDMNVDTNPCQVILKHITQKIGGYKSQDVKKSLYEPEKIVDVPYVLKTLENAENICYYCKESVKVLYEKAREPLQWSLDRIDNSIGHNKENVVIACLQCNVGRKTMHQGRYEFTKQLVITKL